MMWLQNTGLLDKFFIEALNPPVPIPQKLLRVNEPLNLQQLGTAAMVMLAGMIVSALFFFIELCSGTPEQAQEKEIEERRESIKKVGRHNTTFHGHY